MAAWGLFEKRDVRNLSRVASARTLDGYKVRAKLALHFPKAVSMAEADATMMDYARAFAAAIEAELGNGEPPFEEHELLERITTRVTSLPKRSVRVMGLHVWHKGAISSRSLPAIKPGNASNPTLPAIRRVRPEGSADEMHTRATARPDPAGSTSSGPSRTPPSIPAGRSVPAPRSPEATGRVSRAAPVGSHASSAAPMARATGASGMKRVASAAARPSRVSSASQAALPSSTRGLPGVGMVSGVMRAGEPKIVRSKSGFVHALQACSDGSGGQLGAALAQPVRNAAALVLFASFEACHDQLRDPLRLLDVNSDPDLRRKLIGEACVCVSYLLYECLIQTRVPQMQCIEVVQAACIAALGDDSMPVSEISRYLATESPREELSGRLTGLLGVRETPELQQKIESTLRSLRMEVRASTAELESKLAGASPSGRAAGIAQAREAGAR